MRDHKLRELEIEDRTLEAHYGGFVLSQSKKGASEAHRLALDVSYGQAARDARIVGRAARAYERGPEPPPDDIDGRSPSVVTWCDTDMFFLIASAEMSSDDLLDIARSLYKSRMADYTLALADGAGCTAWNTLGSETRRSMMPNASASS